MDPDSFISGNFYLIRLFIFCYIGTVKNTVIECSQFIQNKEQNVNYSVLYRNYLFDTRRVILSLKFSLMESKRCTKKICCKRNFVTMATGNYGNFRISKLIQMTFPGYIQ